MFTIKDLAQLIYSYTLTKQKFFAAAERALKKNLQSYMRPDLFGTSTGNIRLDNILVSIANRFGTLDDEEKRIFLEDVASDFISKEKADELRDILEAKLVRKHSISKELADKFISTSKILVDEERKEFDRVKKDIVNIVSKYIYNYFNSEFKDWSKRKEKELEVKKEVSPGIAVLPDSTLLEQAEKEQEWQEGLVKDLFSLINKDVEKEKQYGYKMILLKRFMAKSSEKMTIPEISAKIKVPVDTLRGWEKDLGRRLATFLSASGLGPKFVNEGGLYKKDIKIPEPKDVLKNKENLNDFKDFIKESIARMQKGGSPKGDDFKKILDLLVEGKSTKEVAQEGFNLSKIRNTKTLYFNKWYKEWYDSMVKNIREASERIIKALMIINAEALPSPSHEKAVNRILTQKFPLELTVIFSANYDRQDLKQDKEKGRYQIDPEKDEIDFKYLNYQVNLERTSKPRIIYTYNQKLSEKGEFIGSPQSRLTIEGSQGNDLLKKRLDDYVEDEMKPEGVLPYGPSVKSRKPVRIPVEYVNNSLDETKTYDGIGKRTYKPFTYFADRYKGFMVEDQPHLTRVEEEGKREQKLLMPKGGKNEIRKTIINLKENIEDEKGEKPPDQKKIKMWEDQIKELNDHLKKDSVEELNSFITKNQELLKFAVSEERLKNVREMMKLQDLVKNQEDRLLARRKTGDPKDEASLELKEEIKTNNDKIEKLKKLLEQTKEPFPPPESGQVKKLLSGLSDLGIKDKKLEEYLSPTDLQFYANQVQGALAKEAQDNIAGVKKNKNMSEEEKVAENEAIERKRGIKLNNFIELFEAVPADMKKRLEKYKKDDPGGFNKLEKKHGKFLTWVDNPKDAINKIKQKLSIPKALGAPKGKPESVVPMEEEDAKFMLNWVENQLNGFSVIGDRFGKASVVAKGLSSDEKDRVGKQLKKTEEEFQTLRNKLSEIEGKEGTTPKEIDTLKGDIPRYLNTISTLKSSLSASNEIPALIMANILSERVSDFTRMYNPLSKTLWFKPVTYEKRAEIVTSENGEKLITLQENIAKNADSLARQNIFDKESIQSLSKAIQSGLTKFKKDIPKMASISYDKIVVHKSLPYLTVQEKVAINTRYSSVRGMHFSDEGNKKIEKFFEKLKGMLTEEDYKNAEKDFSVFSDDYTKAVSKIYNRFPKDSTFRESAEDAVDQIGSALADDFISQWDHLLRAPKKTEGKKYTHLYRMVMDEVPDLKTDVPAEKIDLSRGLPTPEDIRKFYEKVFSDGFVEKVEKKYKDFGKEYPKYNLFKDISGAGGGSGGGGGGGGRKKEPKPNPPSYPKEKIKSDFKKVLQSKSAHEIVLGEIGKYLHDIQSHVKAGTNFDVDKVIEQVISLLYEFKKIIKSLRVSSKPATTTTKKKKGPPPPDIHIKDELEGKKLFNKLSDIYKLIDMLVSDEKGQPLLKIGPLQSDLSKIKTQRGEPDTWFPKGLMEYEKKTREDIEEGMKEKHKAPKEASSPKIEKRVSTQFLAFRLAHKFSSIDLKKIENLEESINK